MPWRWPTRWCRDLRMRRCLSPPRSLVRDRWRRRCGTFRRTRANTKFLEAEARDAEDVSRAFRFCVAMLRYWLILKLPWREAVESPPTQTSKVADSSTQDFVAVLQYVSSSFPSEK